MKYLFGDSSASPFEVNYIDLLRRSLEVLADVVRAESEIAALHDDRRRVEAQARADEASLAQLAAKVHDLLSPIASESGASPAARCADAIRKAAASKVEAEVTRVRGAVSSRCTELSHEELGKRRRCHERLESLLVDYDLPGMRSILELDLCDNAPYTARLRGATHYDMTLALRLEVPDGHAFGKPVRVQQLAPDLEIHLPETGGWIRKEIRMVRHKLGKMYVARVVVSPDEVELALRNHPQIDDSGYDVVVDRGKSSAAVYEVVNEGRRGERFDVGDGDEPAMCDLAKALVEAIEDIEEHRRELLAFEVDERSIADDGELAAVTDRIVAAMAPDVAAIAEHSLSPTELVLRRSLSGDRREELFASKTDLAAALDALTPELRSRFAPLGLPLSDRPPTSELELEQILEVADQSVPEAVAIADDDEGWIEPADEEEEPDAESERTRPHESAPHERADSKPV